ncbi:hypothetical protein CEB3_c02910 [Peptococcaceae bacterium CEB3]|nr:hypothetical protein CEB3_c02910 [Peptococcaceae bacterium CEB3]
MNVTEFRKKVDKMNAKQLYNRAYDLQYVEENFEEALKTYNQIISEFPDSKEAGYAKSQISNLEGTIQKPKTMAVQEGGEPNYAAPLEERYPILRSIASLYKVLAVLVGILAVILIVMGMGGAPNVGMIIESFIGGLIGVVILLAMSEGITVFLDIEENTRRLALQQGKS